MIVLPELNLRLKYVYLNTCFFYYVSFQSYTKKSKKTHLSLETETIPVRESFLFKRNRPYFFKNDKRT